jgi:small-conductance mechanosensitive channel
MLSLFWLSYLFLLKEISPERHGRIKRQGKNCAVFSAITFVFTISSEYIYTNIVQVSNQSQFIITSTLLLMIIGLATGFYWSLKVMRLCSYIGLFLYSKKTPVPLLLINLLTTLVGAVLALGITSKVFGISITPVLATSAILSLVLGLALQDTLGNLLSGIALQIDKPYRIGEWIECNSGNLKVSGKVQEISWRATTLKSFTDEVIVIPNRTMSSAHILNFSRKSDLVLRSHIFRLPFNAPFKKIELMLLNELEKIEGICTSNKASFLLVSNEENWVQCKLLYTVLDFGAQFTIGDQVLRAAHNVLTQEGVQLAKPQLELFRQNNYQS